MRPAGRWLGGVGVKKRHRRLGFQVHLRKVWEFCWGSKRISKLWFSKGFKLSIFGQSLGAFDAFHLRKVEATEM